MILAIFIRMKDGRHALRHQRCRIVSIHPVKKNGKATPVVAVMNRNPLPLPNPRIRQVRPEIHSHDLGMGKPHRPMMVMIGRAGMSHSCEF